MEEKVLQELGLTENEARIYLCLLKKGTLNLTEIASKIPVHRVNIYDILKRLTEKGLVSSVIEGKSKFYSATEPDYFLKILRQKEDMFKKILPTLELNRNSSKEDYEVNVFQGKKGIQAILEDTLKQSKTIYVFGAQGNFAENLPIYFEQYNMKRRKSRAKMKIIHSEKLRGWRNKHPIEFADVKFISSFYDSPATTFIYSDKVAFILWMTPSIGISISSKELSKSYLTFFNILWNLSKK